MSRYAPFGILGFAGFVGSVVSARLMPGVLASLLIEISIGALMQVLLAFVAGIWITRGSCDFVFSVAEVVDWVAVASIWVGVGQLLSLPFVGAIALFSGAWSMGIGVAYFGGRRLARHQDVGARS